MAANEEAGQGPSQLPPPNDLEPPGEIDDPVYADPGALPPPGGLQEPDPSAGDDAVYPSDDPDNAVPDTPVDVAPVDGQGRLRKQKSVRPSLLYADKPIITRLHVLELVSQKEWWYQGQTALCFTLVLWTIFIYIMYMRAGVDQSYDLHLSVQQHMEGIIAHPLLSGIRVRAVEDNPLPCRCACQSSSAGMPKGPCDSDASEMIDFLGLLPASSPRLPELSSAALISAEIRPETLGDKLDAGNDDIVPMTWDRISEPEDVWFWVEHGLIPDLWRQRSQEGGGEKGAAVALQGLVAQKNLLIGGMRARQNRAVWSATCEEKVIPELAAFYRTDCRSSEFASASYGPAAPSMASALSPSLAAPFKPSTSSDAEGDYDALFDIELNVSDALETASTCRKYKWIDAATRSVNLQSVALNAEIGMFAIIDIQFEFPPGGGVDKKVKVHTIHAVGSKIEFSDIIPELMWAGMIALLLRQEITQMMWAGWERRCLDYWLDLWCVVDWVSIFVSILISIFWLWQISSIGAISDSIAKLPRAPFASGLPADMNAYRAQWEAILDDCTSVFERKQYYQLSLFWYAMILTSRFLKGFLAQAKLAMLQLTIGTTFWDLCHLLIFLGTLFLNFQLGGHVLFGSELEEWSTMVAAGSTTVRFMLGNYEFDPMFEVAPVSAACWFWGFLLTMVFILLNLIFAMVADYFHVIRGSIGDTDSILEDSRKAVKDLWWRFGWRRIQLEDREFKAAFIENPYQNIVQDLMEASEVPASLERDARHSCLGVRLGRRHMEGQSIEGIKPYDKETKTGNKGYVEATSKGIQEFGPDIIAAPHLLELAFPQVLKETERSNASQLAMVRHFVDLLRQHRHELDEHCSGLEAEVTGDHTNLAEKLDYIEASVRGCLDEFDRVKEQGVHSLAPALQALPRPGTLAAREQQNQSLVAPGALLRSIDLQQTPVPPKPVMPPIEPHNISNAMLMNAPQASVMAIADKIVADSNPVSPKSRIVAASNPLSPKSSIGGGSGINNMAQLRDAGNADGNRSDDRRGALLPEIRDRSEGNALPSNAMPAIDDQQAEQLNDPVSVDDLGEAPYPALSNTSYNDGDQHDPGAQPPPTITDGVR